MYFLDINTNKIITVEQLETEFNHLKAEQPDEYNYTFEEYITNCTNKNGSLEIVVW